MIALIGSAALAYGMATPGNWKFGVTAKLNGAQSDLSNILVVQLPEPSPGLKTVLLTGTVTVADKYAP